MVQRVASALALVVVAFTAVPRGQQPSVDSVLQAGRAYVVAYAQRVSGAVLDEKYTINEVSSGRMQVPVRIGSDLILLNVNGLPIALRDAYSINGAKIRDAKPRVPALLAEPTQEAWAQVQGYARESQRHFLADIIVRLNDPMLVLRYINPSDPTKFTYSIDGKKKVNGVETVGLRFEENRGEQVKYVLGTRGNAAVSGRYFLDPATGAIHQTEFFVESKTESGRIIVTYGPAAGLDMLLPARTTETYQEREPNEGPSNMGGGTYGSSQKFEANAAYSNPRHSPIDLRTMRR